MNARTVVVAAAVAASVGLAGRTLVPAQQAGAHDHVLVDPAAVHWVNGPGSLPAGAQYALIEGDWTKKGPFTARLKLPADYRIPPHWHPAIEHVTVIDGSFYMGLGETFDQAAATRLPRGGFAVMPIGARHFAFTREASVIQLHGIGPWGITYVDRADDPRKTE